MGNTPGGKLLSYGISEQTQQFGKHLIFTGLSNLYEGMTLCYPNKLCSSLQVVAMSSDSQPCIIVADWPNIPQNQGRVIIDCNVLHFNFFNIKVDLLSFIITGILQELLDI